MVSPLTKQNVMKAYRGDVTLHTSLA